MTTVLVLYLIAFVVILMLFLDQLWYIHRVYGVKNWFLEEVHYIISLIHKFFNL